MRVIRFVASAMISAAIATPASADVTLRSRMVQEENGGRRSNWPGKRRNKRRDGRPIICVMHASERLNRCGPAAAKSGVIRCIPLIAFAILLSPTHSSARRGSQEFRPGSVPLVPTILKSGVTISEPCPHTASMEPKRYMIAWNDTPGIDGDFILVVHPTQLFLRSAHNNPNPNFVYWVEQISDGQYMRIVKLLDAYRVQLFRRNRWDRWPGYTLFTLTNPQISPQPAERMTRESESARQLKSDAAVNSNLRRILRELNRGLAEDGKLRVDVAINSYPNIVRIGQ